MSRRYGGVQTVVSALAKYQKELGLDVQIATTDLDAPEPILHSCNEQSRSLKKVAVHYFHVDFRPILYSKNFAKYCKIELNNFDLVHIHGLYRFPVTYAAFIARKKRIPYVISPHGALDPFLYRRSSYGKVALPVKRIYEKFFDMRNLNFASVIHYTAQEELERVRFLQLKAATAIVPNGIDWIAYYDLPEREKFRHAIGLSGRNPLVLFLGRIHLKKGLDLLVRSFAFVAQEIPDARLAIVGPDKDGYLRKVRQWCNELDIAEKIFFIGFLDSEEVKQAYVDADVFVLPSYTENFGMTVVEAMACGCPVVISDQVNIWREVQEEEAGLVVGLDPPEIAAAICRIISEKQLAAEMGENGRRAAKERYDWGNIVHKLSDVYERVIAEAAANLKASECS